MTRLWADGCLVESLFRADSYRQGLSTELPLRTGSTCFRTRHKGCSFEQLPRNSVVLKNTQPALHDTLQIFAKHKCQSPSGDLRSLKQPGNRQKWSVSLWGSFQTNPKSLPLQEDKPCGFDWLQCKITRTQKLTNCTCLRHSVDTASCWAVCFLGNPLLAKPKGKPAFGGPLNNDKEHVSAVWPPH